MKKYFIGMFVMWKMDLREKILVFFLFFNDMFLYKILLFKYWIDFLFIDLSLIIINKNYY